MYAGQSTLGFAACDPDPSISRPLRAGDHHPLFVAAHRELRAPGERVGGGNLRVLQVSARPACTVPAPLPSRCPPHPARPRPPAPHPVLGFAVVGLLWGSDRMNPAPSPAARAPLSISGTGRRGCAARATARGTCGSSVSTSSPPSAGSARCWRWVTPSTRRRSCTTSATSVHCYRGLRNGNCCRAVGRRQGSERTWWGGSFFHIWADSFEEGS